MPVSKALIDKIQAMPPDCVAKIQHFVGFITALEQERLRLSGAARASSPLSLASGKAQKTTYCTPFEFH